MSGAPSRVVLSVFSTFAVGGPQVRFAALANHFGPAYRHMVVAMDGNTACRERLSSSLDVTFPPIQIRKGATWANRRSFREALRAWRPDVLVTNNWGAIEWAMANLPRLTRHVHIEDGFGPEERDRQIPRRVWTRRLVLHWSTVALPSRRLTEIAGNIWRLPRENLRYIPNGIDLSRFLATHDNAVAAGWRGTGAVIGTVAALRAEKNLARLIRAFGRVTAEQDARLVIAGDGPERAALEALAASLGLNDRISFTGHSADPSAIYPGFDLFALSSDTEQMPISVMEAMAAGLPVAATDVGDVRTMLAEENADVLATRDDAALADRILALLRDPRLRARLGTANRAKALRDFDQTRMFAAYAALFDGRAPP